MMPILEATIKRASGKRRARQGRPGRQGPAAQGDYRPQQAAGQGQGRHLQGLSPGLQLTGVSNQHRRTLLASPELLQAARRSLLSTSDTRGSGLQSVFAQPCCSLLSLERLPILVHGWLQGYETKDRRKPHVKEADEKLAELLEEEPQEAEEEAPEGELRLDEVCKDPAQFEVLVQTTRVLMRAGRAWEALELVTDCITHLTRRWGDK